MRGLWQMREEAELACPFWATEDLKRFVRNRFGLRDVHPTCRRQNALQHNVWFSGRLDWGSSLCEGMEGAAAPSWGSCSGWQHPHIPSLHLHTHLLSRQTKAHATQAR